MTYEEKYKDGELKARKKIKEEITQEPRNRIVLVGTMEEATLIVDSPADGQSITASRVVITGSTEEGATVKINDVKATVGSSAPTFKFRLALQEGPNSIHVKASKEGRIDKTISLTVIRELSEAEFKAACKTIPYRQLDKDADKLKGLRVSYWGLVGYTPREKDGNTFIQLFVTRGYNGWDDQVLVVVGGSIDVYRGDLIRVWGEVHGLETYESETGASITVPRVDGRYLSKYERRYYEDFPGE